MAGGTPSQSQSQSQGQVSASPLLGGLSAASPSLTTSLAHSVPSLIPSSVSSSFPLLAPSRSLSSHSPHSPPLSLTQPPRPPSASSPQSLVKERDRETSRLLRDRDMELREHRERDLLGKRKREEEDKDLREGEDASPPHCQPGEHPGAPTSPLQLTPVLVESQIQRIADTAAALVKSLPVAELEPKQPNAKKKICKELEVSGG